MGADGSAVWTAVHVVRCVTAGLAGGYPAFMKEPLALLALLTGLVFPSLSAAAQSPAGLLTGMPPQGVVRVSIGTAVGSEMMLRIPGDVVRGLGEYVPPASHRFRGVLVQVRDNTLGDGGVFDVHVYLENGNTGLPTITGPMAPGTTAVASVIGVTTPQGIGDHEVEVVFAQPVDVPIGKDVFVSIVMQQAGQSLRAVGGTGLAGFSSSSLDACGAGLPANESFAFLHDAGAVTPMGSSLIGWQPMIDLLVDGSSGVAVSARSANGIPTASFYSGLHPDSASPSNQTARHDTPGYVFLANGTLPQGSPVFLLGSLQPFANMPFVVLQPGNAILHLWPAGLMSFGMAMTDATGRADVMWPVPASSVLRGLQVRTQGIGFDVASGAAHAGGAACQRF